MGALSHLWADFFSDINQYHSEASHKTFHFVAVQTEQQYYALLKGRLVFTPNSPNPTVPFQQGEIIAGQFDLRELETTAEDFIEQLLSPGLRTPVGLIRLEATFVNAATVHYEPLSQSGIQVQSRHSILTVPGVETSTLIKQPDLDWALKAGEVPFDSLLELFAYYSVGQPVAATSISLEAMNSVEVDMNKRVEGTEAKLGVFLAKGLDRSKVSLGYKVLESGTFKNRGIIHGSDMTWTEADRSQNGEFVLAVPNAAVVQCFASYNKIAQHQAWIADPKHSQNPRRAIYDSVDPDFTLIKQFLQASPGGEARDLELAVEWLSWMLGFTPIVFHPKKQSDAPDLVAAAPNGNLAVIECTTSLLKGDKLSKLVARTAEIKSKLIQSNYGHLEVLSVFVTTRTKAETRTDIASVKSQGVLPLTQEDLFVGLDRTLVLPDPNVLFNEAIVRLKT